MNTDARISVTLPAHPKTVKLIRRGGAGAAWHLVRLFLWASQNKPSGDLIDMSDEDIEIAAGWDGEEGKFVSMLVAVGFLDGRSEEYLIHDWADHNPWAAGAEGRAEHARKASQARWSKTYGVPANAPSMQGASSEHARSMQPGQSGNAPSPSPSPIPTPTPTPTPTPSPTPEPESNSDDEPAAPASVDPDPVTVVFNHWRQVMGHSQAKLDDKRRKVIKAAIKIGYDAGALCLAVDGCKRSPFHMGKNDRATVYDDLGLILRSADHIDKFVRLSQQPDLTTLSPAGRQTVVAAQSWLESHADQPETADETH